MKSEEATDLLKSFATSVADWQRSAMLGRGVKTSSTKAKKITEKLFATITGEEPTDEQITRILTTVGDV